LRLVITLLLHLLRLLPFLVGGHRHLALENLALRQQLAVYKRSAPRPKLTPLAESFRGAYDRVDPARVPESRARPSERRLRRILTCYVTYYHQVRTHLALDKDAPDRRPVELPADKIVQLPEVGGLHHRYLREAA
jgi:hypothetical protein